MVLINFVHFMVGASKIIPLDKPVVAFTQQLLQYQWALMGSVAVGTFVHLCRRGLASSPLQAQFCGNHCTYKEVMFRAITILHDQGGRCF